MKVAILGSGAMGCLFGAAFHRAGCNVTLIDIDQETVLPLHHDARHAADRRYDDRQRVLHRVEQDAADPLPAGRKNKDIEGVQVIADIVDKSCKGQIIQTRRKLPQHRFVRSAANEYESNLRARLVQDPRGSDYRILRLLVVVERTDVTDDERTAHTLPDRLRLFGIGNQTTAAAQYHSQLCLRFERAHDIGNLRRDSDDAGRMSIGQVCHSVISDRVINPSSRDIRRPRQQMPQQRRIDASPLMDVDQVCAAGRADDSRQMTGYLADFDSDFRDSLCQRRAPACNQTLFDAAQIQLPNQ